MAEVAAEALAVAVSGLPAGDEAGVSTADAEGEGVDAPEEQPPRASRVAARTRVPLAGIRDHLPCDVALRREEY